MKVSGIDKIIVCSISILWMLIVWSIYSDMMFKSQCRDAGGISVDSACINPSVIIEVD